MSISTFDEPKAVDVQFEDRRMIVRRSDGSIAQVPLDWFPRLSHASEADLADWRLIGRGVGIHWERLDEDLLVEPLFSPVDVHRPVGPFISLDDIQKNLRLTEERISVSARALEITLDAQRFPSPRPNNSEQFARTGGSH